MPRVSEDVIEVIEMGTGVRTSLIATHQTSAQIDQPKALAVKSLRLADEAIESLYTDEAIRSLYDDWHATVVDRGVTRRKDGSTVWRAGQGKKPLPPPPIIRYGPPGEDWKLGWNDCIGDTNHHYIKVWYAEGIGLAACERLVTYQGNLKRKDRKICSRCHHLRG